MLAIARGLMSRPRILLLDEPSLGLAPKVIAELFAALDRLRREGMTLLLVDQMAGLALALADRAYVIEGGRIVAQGTAGGDRRRRPRWRRPTSRRGLNAPGPANCLVTRRWSATLRLCDSTDDYSAVPDQLPLGRRPPGSLQDLQGHTFS